MGYLYYHIAIWSIESHWYEWSNTAHVILMRGLVFSSLPPAPLPIDVCKTRWFYFCFEVPVVKDRPTRVSPWLVTVNGVRVCDPPARDVRRWKKDPFSLGSPNFRGLVGHHCSKGFFSWERLSMLLVSLHFISVPSTHWTPKMELPKQYGANSVVHLVHWFQDLATIAKLPSISHYLTGFELAKTCSPPVQVGIDDEWWM